MPDGSGEDNSQLNPQYKYPYDDPYKVLAFNLITTYPPETIRRFLLDRKFLRREIIREVRSQDFQGLFVDCLWVAMCDEKQRMQIMRQLDSLGRFFYQNLDVPHMRDEIRKAYHLLGLDEFLPDVETPSKIEV